MKKFFKNVGYGLFFGCLALPTLSLLQGCSGIDPVAGAILTTMTPEGLEEKIKENEQKIAKNNAAIRDLTEKLANPKLHPGDREILSVELAVSKEQNITMEQKNQAFKEEIKRLKNQSAKACFPRGTRVLMADGSMRSIETLQAGDAVQTLDIRADAPAVRPVVQAYEGQNTHYYLINDSLRVTAGERFLTQDGWKAVERLTTQDSLTLEGEAMTPVTSISLVYEPLTVHNLQVLDAHNFYVVDNAGRRVLVHNTSGGGGGGGGGGGKGGGGGGGGRTSGVSK